MNMCNDKNLNFEIEIHSFASIEKKTKEKFSPTSTMLISIGDPDAPPPRLLYKPKYMLRLVFDDISPEMAVERLDLPISLLEDEEKLEKILRRYNTKLYSTSLAKRMAEFIKTNINNVNLILCQCEFGQSRSSAVAAAILEKYNGTGKVIFEDSRYSPNSFVYNKLLAALNNVDI